MSPFAQGSLGPIRRIPHHDPFHDENKGNRFGTPRAFDDGGNGKETVMTKIKHILFPIDFSERCCGAGPFVGAMARHYDAKVTLLNVLAPFWYSNAGEMPIIVDIEELKRDLEARLANTFVKQFADLRVQRVVEVGDPAAVITDFAEHEGVDLIMMPSHGYGPFRRLLLGSVTAKVLYDAKCPVWTGAHMEQPTPLDHLAFRNVLCAVDETPKSGPLIEQAAQYAKDLGAALRLVHVVPATETWPERQFGKDFEEDLRQQARDTIGKLQQSVNVAAPLCVVAGNVAETVQEEARRHHADLLVIGRGALHETLGRLRTNAHAIIREAPCPVLSV
jgi:nucleotide-binding universal stress UspA family protein